MQKVEKKVYKNVAPKALFLYSISMDESLHNMDVIITFEVILLAKADLCKHQQTASLALQFIIGNTAFIYNDTAPITKNAILPLIAKGPLALWAHKNLFISEKLIIQVIIKNNEASLLKIIPQ